eukprot:3791899-Rhodomonas_salina.1
MGLRDAERRAGHGVCGNGRAREDAKEVAAYCITLCAVLVMAKGMHLRGCSAVPSTPVGRRLRVCYAQSGADVGRARTRIEELEKAEALADQQKNLVLARYALRVGAVYVLRIAHRLVRYVLCATRSR